MKPVRVGIVGAGVMGRGHAEFIRDHIPEASVVAVSDVDSQRRESLAEDIGPGVKAFATPEGLVDANIVDSLIIASPDSFHVQHLRLALAAELPTLCEKPIATSLAEAELIAEKIREVENRIRRPLVHFGFMRRFDPSYIQVKEAIQSGAYGEVLFVRTTTRNVSSPGITSEGLYTNIAVHDFDIWRWMLSDEWLSVSSHYPKSSSFSPDGLIDPLVFTAQMQRGVLVVGDVIANNNYGYDLRTEVVCEKGSIEIGLFGDVHTRANFLAEPVMGGQMVQNWIPRSRKAYIAELSAWVTSIGSGVSHPDLANVEDAVAATAACFLALDSLES
jgi:myo-inositol 2-dehydrogenase / D-chiro-inositol 1-dehydrogenase